MRSANANHLAFVLITLCSICLLQFPGSAAVPVGHPAFEMRSAYEANTYDGVFAGYQEYDERGAAYAGRLKIDPGDNWANYVSASAAGVGYSVEDITMVKTVPESPGASFYCQDVFASLTIMQTGGENIRLIWPLVYEAPGTDWTLTISYTTTTAWDDDGPGPNPAAFTHTEIWQWNLGADIAHLKQLLILLHDMAFGTSEVPVASDETLYPGLLATLSAAEAEEAAGHIDEARTLLQQFQTSVQDACIATCPISPYPTGPGTGIASTWENPACCKLQLEVAYILSQPPYTVGSGAPAVTRSVKAPSGSESTTASGDNIELSHGTYYVYSAVSGDSAGNPIAYRGINGVVSGEVAVPGVLGILPGENWANFVGAAQEGVVDYDIADVTLTKSTPSIIACADTFPAMTITQSGTDNVRLWWPTMYETPGTTWRLTIDYTTTNLYDDDGPGPNEPSYQHSEVWSWMVDCRLDGLSTELDLFLSLPFGTSEVPLISDGPLYDSLQEAITSTIETLDYGDYVTAGGILAGVGWAVDGRTIWDFPMSPAPSGPGTGIAGSEENPTACKLMSDIDYVRYDLGIDAAADLQVFDGNEPTVHPAIEVRAAYQGDLQGTPRIFAGYDPAQSGTAAYPGTLTIVPGDGWWSNFVGTAALEWPIPYVVSPGLMITTPRIIQCADYFPERIMAQIGSWIRLQWPLFYATAGTEWQVTLLSETCVLWDDDGPGPNRPSYYHADVWTWVVEADIESIKSRLMLLRDTPIGVCEMPLISNEVLYAALIDKLDAAQEAYDAMDYVTCGLILGDFEMEVQDACISVAPMFPNPTGPGTGVLNSMENPACCALLADAEHFALDMGLFPPFQGDTTTLEAARVPVRPSGGEILIDGDNTIRHASQMLAPASIGSSGANPVAYLGYLGDQTGAVPFPGVLGLLPDSNWANFIAAAESGSAYTLDNVGLAKSTPGVSHCADVFEPHTTTQEGDGNVRLWWPLMYDVPGTTYTLSLEYSTVTEQQFPGETEPSTIHSEEWTWQIGSEIGSLQSLTELFHAMPFGLDDVPLISDEDLYPQLRDGFANAADLFSGGDIVGAKTAISALKQPVDDACLYCSPMFPSPTGPGTGIANSQENPSCCYLHICMDSLLGLQTYASINAATTQAQDGEAIALPGPLVVTHVGVNWFYAQSIDRSSAVKAMCDIPWMSPGARIALSGIMATDGPERVIESANWTTLDPSGSLPDPLGLVSRDLGGSGKGYLSGFAGASGLWNGGLRVMVAGKVASSGEGFFYLDDGSQCSDGTGQSGLRVILPSGTTPPADGNMVRVTGISSWFDAPGQARPALLAGDGPIDVLVIQ